MKRKRNLQKDIHNDQKRKKRSPSSRAIKDSGN